MEVMTLHPDLTIGQGVVMEAWLTFILMQTIWGSINSRRRRVLLPSIPIGLAYVADILAGVRILNSLHLAMLQILVQYVKIIALQIIAFTTFDFFCFKIVKFSLSMI